MKKHVLLGFASPRTLIKLALVLATLVTLVVWLTSANSELRIVPVTQAKVWELKAEDELRTVHAQPPTRPGQDIHLPHSQDRGNTSTLSNVSCS